MNIFVDQTINTQLYPKSPINPAHEEKRNQQRHQENVIRKDKNEFQQNNNTKQTPQESLVNMYTMLRSIHPHAEQAPSQAQLKQSIRELAQKNISFEVNQRGAVWQSTIHQFKAEISWNAMQKQLEEKVTEKYLDER